MIITRVDVTVPQVNVKYLMTFSQVTRKRSETLTLSPGATLDDLISMLYGKYGRKFKKLVESSLGYRSVIIAINGEPKSRNTVLKDGDEILISYPVGGG
jgi:MoaD family protein